MLNMPAEVPIQALRRYYENNGVRLAKVANIHVNVVNVTLQGVYRDNKRNRGHK